MSDITYNHASRSALALVRRRSEGGMTDGRSVPRTSVRQPSRNSVAAGLPTAPATKSGPRPAETQVGGHLGFEPFRLVPRSVTQNPRVSAHGASQGAGADDFGATRGRRCS